MCDFYCFELPAHPFYPTSHHSFVIKGHDGIFVLQKKTWTAIMGPSGVGKTTLLRSLSLRQPSDFSSEQDSDTQEKNRTIAFLGPGDHLIPWLNLETNIALSSLLQKKTIDRERLHALLKIMVLHGYEKSYPHTVSTGMQKRALLARTLYLNRPILFLDEPFANLDAVTKKDIVSLLKKYCPELTFLFITHDIQETVCAETVYILGHDSSPFGHAEHQQKRIVTLQKMASRDFIKHPLQEVSL